MREGSVVFGRYLVEKRLAVGGMGEVFLARHPGGLVVLKALLPGLETKPDAVEQFLAEARLAARLTHPNVVRVFEVGSFEGRQVLSMEYVEGLTVAELVEGCRATGRVVPPLVAARLIADAAEGLAHAHAATDEAGRPLGLVHRDVTPSNLLVGLDGRTRLIDFGIARAADSQWRTATGVLKGKLAYVAPEQAAGAPASAASDQYALGLVLHEVLSGARALRADSEVQLFQRVLAGEVAPLGRGDVPMALDMVRQRMVLRAPLARHASCAEVAQVLGALAPAAVYAEVGRLVAEVRALRPDERPARPPADAWTPLSPQDRTVQTPAPRAPRPAVAPSLTTMERWLATLPAGLDSYPEATQKGSVCAAFLEGVDLRPLEGRLPAPLAELLKYRPTAASWVSEVKATALYLACAEACFPGEAAYVDFARRTNRRLLGGPLYGMLFRALGTRRVLEGAASRWEHLHRGSRLEVVEHVEHRARVRLETPPNLVPPLIASCYGTVLQAVIEVSGAKAVDIAVRVESPTHHVFEGSWT
jgi:tRNA A-37 threonylcarbamoyl transferase component Bud32